MILSCMCLIMGAILLINQAHGLYCVQCESTNDSLCGVGLIPPTKCANKDSIACMTMIGKLPGENSYIQRACASKLKGSFCTILEPVPGLNHELCVQTCTETGCNARPVADIDFN